MALADAGLVVLEECWWSQMRKQFGFRNALGANEKDYEV